MPVDVVVDEELKESFEGAYVAYWTAVDKDRGDFGTDVFMNKVFYDILNGNRSILNIGLGTDLKMNLGDPSNSYSNIESGYNTTVNIGTHVTEKQSPVYEDTTYNILEHDFSYKIGLTDDEINSVDSNVERWKIFLNKVKDKLEKEIIPEVLSERKRQLSEQIIRISEAEEKLNEINEPRASSSDFEM